MFGSPDDIRRWLCTPARPIHDHGIDPREEAACELGDLACKYAVLGRGERSCGHDATAQVYEQCERDVQRAIAHLNQYREESRALRRVA